MKKETESITIENVDNSKDIQKISSFCHSKLVDDDLVWFDGKKWLFDPCIEFTEKLKKYKNLELTKDMI